MALRAALMLALAAVTVTGAVTATAANRAEPAPDASGGGPDQHESPSARVWRYAHLAAWDVPGVLLRPIDIAYADDGHLVVTDGRRNAVRIYSADGELLRWWDKQGAVASCEPLVPFAVAMDNVRDKLHVGWHCYSEGRLQPRGFYLETRSLDGAEAGLFEPVGIISAADFDVHRPTGDLVVAGPRAIFRVSPDDGDITDQHAIDPVGGAPRRLAVRNDLAVAVVRSTAAGVEIVQFGEAEDNIILPIEGYKPLAVTADGFGIHVLVRPVAEARPPVEPRDSVIVTFDEELTEIGSLLAVNPAPLPPPNDGWPWALVSSGAGFALTTGTERFQVQTVGMDGIGQVAVTGGPVDSNFVVSVVGAGGGTDSLAVAARPAGGVAVVDRVDNRIVHFDAHGQAVASAAVANDTVDIAVGADGALFASVGDSEVVRLPDDAGAGGWSVPCDCDLGGRLTVDGGALIVARPERQRAARLGLLTGVDLGDLVLPDARGLWPVDVAGAGRRLVTAHLGYGQVQLWDGDRLEDTWASGTLAGPRRVALGPGPEGATVAAVLTSDNRVEVHRLDGTLLAEWSPVTFSGAPIRAGDLAIASDGRLHIADPALRAVHVFRPEQIGAEPPRQPTPPAPPTADPEQPPCEIDGVQWAPSSPVMVSRPFEVGLHIDAVCVGATKGVDMVLAMDRSSSMAGPKLDAAKLAARDLVERVDVRHFRVGVVAFSDDATIVTPVTDDVAGVIRGLQDLTANGGTNLTAALRRSADNLEANGRASAMPVIVLLSDGIHTGGTSDPIALAASLRDAGVVIYVVGLGQVDSRILREIAGHTDRAFLAPTVADLYPIYDEILHRLTWSPPGGLLIRDTAGNGIERIVGSSSPPALQDATSLMWSQATLPDGRLEYRYEARALESGRLPVSSDVRIEYTDRDGIRRSRSVTPQVVEVLEPTPRPTETAAASPTPRTVRAFLPHASMRHCWSRARPADIVLLLDASASMAEPEGTGTKADAVRRAVLHFVEGIRLPRDRVAIAAFNETARELVPLTSDAGLIVSGLEGYVPAGGSRLDLAIGWGVEVLQGSAPRSRVIVALSDGRLSAEGRRMALDAAGEANAAGVTIFAVGFGTDVDPIALRAISGPSRYYSARDGEALARVYREIGAAIPCPETDK